VFFGELYLVLYGYPFAIFIGSIVGSIVDRSSDTVERTEDSVPPGDPEGTPFCETLGVRRGPCGIVRVRVKPGVIDGIVVTGIYLVPYRSHRRIHKVPVPVVPLVNIGYVRSERCEEEHRLGLIPRPLLLIRPHGHNIHHHIHDRSNRGSEEPRTRQRNSERVPGRRTLAPKPDLLPTVGHILHEPALLRLRKEIVPAPQDTGITPSHIRRIQRREI